MSTDARHVSSRSSQIATPDRDFRTLPAWSGFATVAAVAAFLPVWLPRPLMTGEFSFAFTVPFVLALWALMQPARPGTFWRAMNGLQGRGLWLEALGVGVAVVLAFTSMLHSEEPIRAFRVILPMTYSICALILLSRASPLTQRRLLFALVFSGALVLGVALLLTQSGSGRLVVMRDYRLRAFVENSNQLGLMLLAVWSLAIALLLNAHTARLRLTCTVTVLVLASAILMSGTKTALALGFVSGALTWVYHGSRSGSLDKTLFKLVIVLCAIVLAVPAILWVLSWASPASFKRVDSILTNGVWEYSTMRSREAIWKESIRIGLANPLLGEGAGTKVLGLAHSHNMFADYFRGMGVFGLAAGVALVWGTVARGTSFFLSTWHKGRTDRPSDTIVVAMYLGAIFYLIGNQLSDSFSPTTAFLYWMMYFGAYLIALPEEPIARRDRHPSTLGWRPRTTRPGRALGAAVPSV